MTVTSRIRRLVLGPLVVAALAVGPASAPAAIVSSDATTVTYQSQQPVTNGVEVRYDAGRGVYLIRELGPGWSFVLEDEVMNAGPGCTRDPDQPDEYGFVSVQQVACPGPREKVVVKLAEGQDEGEVTGNPPGTVILEGGAAGDLLLGGTGDDTLLGGPAADVLEGGLGADTLDEGTSGEPGGFDGGVYGYAQDRFTFGETAAQYDSRYDADGGDTLIGSSGPVHLEGQGGNDTIRAGDVTLVIEGGPGNDAILGEGSKQDPQLDGGEGNDRISGFLARLFIDGGDGNDNLRGNPKNQISGGAGRDTLSGARSADGGPGADKVLGTGAADDLSGDTGNDLLRGAGGADDLDGNTGNDTAFGGPGRDHFSKTFHTGGCGGVELYVGEGGRDTAYLSCGIMRLRLRDGGPDVITCRVPAPAAVAKVLSRDGADRLVGCHGR